MDKKAVLDYLDTIEDDVVKIAMDLWNNPEISDQEDYASKTFIDAFTEQGFKITTYDHDVHAFAAEFGEGSPVIAILGEYDALPGLSQEVCTYKKPVKDGAPGQGCGHNILGTGAYASAVAIKKYLEETKVSGTIKYFGCPAEETLVGKVRLVKNGVFDGCDICISWHPMTANATVQNAFLANNSIKFRFHGISAHAAQSPEAGRSALDAVELMNVGANYMREHIIENSRVHYTITNAGGAPNIVPPEAESWYYVRAPHRRDVEDITNWLIKISEGAALMTGTTTDHELIAGCYEYLTNDVMFELNHKNLEEIPLPVYTEEEKKFAQEIQDSLDPDTLNKERAKFVTGKDADKICMHDTVLPKEENSKVVMAGSSDSGDVSWIMPMNFFMTATWPLGVAAHSWQATASSGSSIGMKGMMYGAKVMAGMAYDLLNDEELVKAAIAEFEERTKNNKYVSPLA